MINPNILEQFKSRMRITHSAEDDNLTNLLSSSIADLQAKCGAFDIEEDERAKELVFERTRYVYNDAIEYFDDNFLSQINSLSLSYALKEGDDGEK